MRKIILIGVVIFSLISCEGKKFPNYELTKISYIPDSLKCKHEKFITETVRAASQHMSAGDYEDVDQTIIQATWTADELFEKEVIGLRKEVNEWDYLELKPNELNGKEIKILDSLLNQQ